MIIPYYVRNYIEPIQLDIHSYQTKPVTDRMQGYIDRLTDYLMRYRIIKRNKACHMLGIDDNILKSILDTMTSLVLIYEDDGYIGLLYG